MSLTYNGQVIEQRQTDNYVNLTQMAKANGVEVRKFNESEFAKKYLKALQESISPDSGLLITQGFGAEKATWGHPLVAIAFGQWISPEFHVWCNIHIQTLMTQGTVSLNPEPKSKISPALLVAREYSEIQSLVSDNPRLAQLLIDSAVNHHLGEQKALSGTNLKGVVEIAEEMGYKTNHSSRVKLGTFIAKQGFAITPESRLCNGMMREINCYEDTPELRKSIKGFFS